MPSSNIPEGAQDGATAVNSQITDSITTSNTMVVGSGPANIMSNVMQMYGHANGLAMQNAVVGQKQTNMLSDAATTQGLSILYTLGASADGQAIDTTDRSSDISSVINALTTESPAQAEQQSYR